jgi:DNA polymerase-2
MKGFILTRHWRDTPTGIAIECWLSTDNGPVQLTIPNQQSVFFIRQVDADNYSYLFSSRGTLHASLRPSLSVSPQSPIQVKPLALKNSKGEKVCGVYCRQYQQAKKLLRELDKHNVIYWEADIRPPERFLMERFITSSIEIPSNTVFKKGALNYCTAKSVRCKSVNYLPELSVVSLDIETSMDARELYSIAVYTPSVSIVFMVGEDESEISRQSSAEINIVWCVNPRECLQHFLAWLNEYDPDIIIGWHVVQFDCWVLSKLCERWKVPFTFGRAKKLPHWRVEGESYGGGNSKENNDKTSTVDTTWMDRQRRYLQVPGRVVLDGIELLRTAFYHFDSFSLQFVANSLLGEGKLIQHNDRGQAISELFFSDKTEDRIALAKYNLQDCKLVWDIFEKTKLLDFAVARSRLTGMPLDKMGGSVASFDYAYLPKLHRRGYVAPNLGELTSNVVSPGGYVMQSLPGLYQHVLVLDFKSLYPSIIRTFSIDPYAFWFAHHQQLSEDEIVDGFNGAFFSRDEHILPSVINELWQERDQAKADNDQPLSQAIKIIMNSFYGVLGSSGCRFFDPRVCSSITLRGHEIIQKSHVWIEEQGYRVIYGDTDSLFVWLGDDFSQKSSRQTSQQPSQKDAEVSSANQQADIIGQDLAKGLNDWWDNYLQDEMAIESQLEIEFETHYYDFLMPTIRGSEKGSKKRYAGTVKTVGSIEPDATSNSDVLENSDESIIDTRLVFKGLEAVRTDWTPLAKRFQQTLYQQVFDKQPYEQYIYNVVMSVRQGECDEELIYRKRLRRDVDQYEKSNPPHVKAARKQEVITGQPLRKGDTIRYVITINGPEAVDHVSSMIDYQHYIDKQLQPIANSILCFVDDSFERIVQAQISLL